MTGSLSHLPLEAEPRGCLGSECPRLMALPLQAVFSLAASLQDNVHVSHVRLFETLGIVALQAPLSMEFSRPEYWSGFSSVEFSSVTQSCPTLCDTMNHSTPGLPIPHQFPEFNQTHIHRVSHAIQPSHPLSSPSLPAPNSSQHQSLFQ